jgi:hypothetical protein
MNDNERENINHETPPDARTDKSPGSVKPSELSRRRFLYIASAAGITPVVHSAEKLKKSNTPINTKIATLPTVEAPLTNLKFSLLRPDDLLTLEFECINLKIQPGSPASLVRIKASDPAYIIVHFPPQHIAEQAFFETTPALKPSKDTPADAAPDPGSDETPSYPPVLTRLSGPSRLAFIVPRETSEIPLTLESLLSWENLDPSLVPVAMPPKVPLSIASSFNKDPSKLPAQVPATLEAHPVPNSAAGAITKNTHLSAAADAQLVYPAAYMPMILPGGAPKENLYNVQTLKLPKTVNLDLLKIVQPAPNQTAIELPYRLLLSPHARNLWAHSTKAVTRYGRTELWHTRLAAANPDGSIVESHNPYMAIRAVWSPDCKIEDPSNGPNHANYPFRMSLDAKDRHSIVHLTSNFKIKHKGSFWEPQPIDVDRLMLTSLGGWLDSAGTWADGPLSVEKWDHRATMGRDHYVKVVYKGYLMPFGHAASLIKITERKFYKGKNSKQIAYLFQRMYIVIRQPEKTFPAPFQAYEGRELPFRKVQITTKMTPPLEDPADTPLIKDALQSAFWPQVGKSDFLFHCIGTDWAGNSAEFAMPMAFIEYDWAYLSAKMKAVVEAYNKPQANVVRHQPLLNGRKIAFAAPKKSGDTDLEAHNITFSAKFPSANPDSPDWKNISQPLFFPAMDTASVSIPALKAMVQLGSTDIRYPETYLQNGLGGANKGEVFVSIPGAPGLDFGAGQGAKAGGVATPSFPIVGLSRALGPVGGLLPSDITDPAGAAESALADVVSGRFDPKKFFDEKAKLLGGILLKDIISLVNDFMGSPDEALKIKNEVHEDSAGTPSEIHTLMTWKPKLQDFTVFVANRDGTNATLTIDAKSIAYLNGQEPYYELKGELKDFTLDLINPIISLIRIRFSKFTFVTKKGQKTVFDPSIAGIEFAGPLTFIKDLLDKIKMPGMGGEPILELSASGARLGYGFRIPDVGFGVFCLQNISLNTSVELPFTGDPLSFRFSFNERSNPFLLTVSMFGGGGFFAIELQPNGIKLIEGSLEFGGCFALNLGVASGSVSIMAGIYFKYEDDNVTLSGYVRCKGVLDVLGLISISAEFYLGLTYEQATDRVWGQASLTVKIKILFFSTSVSMTVEREFGHSPPPMFTDIMDESHWLEYCEAFS